MAEMSQERIQTITQRINDLLLDECRAEGVAFTLCVVDLSQETGSEWMYFVVKPDKEKVRIYDYADVLARVEIRLRRDEHVEHVLLVPSMAA